LAKSYKGLLGGVPQSPEHHPEGDALTHVRLVRKAIPRAIQELQTLQAGNNPLSHVLSDMDFRLSKNEEQILALAAWLHDIGKVTATTTDDRIQSIGHQDSQHYQPQLEKLKAEAPPETVELYLQNEDLLNWLIEHHMDLIQGRFSNRFILENFRDGKALNTPQMRLLLLLMWADKMGRGNPEDVIMASLSKGAERVASSGDKSQRQSQKTEPFQGDPGQFVDMLNQRGMSRDQKVGALRGKFPQIAPADVARLLPEGFRSFMNTEPQATMISAEIPVDQEVSVLTEALKEGDPNVQVYIVGGAVRDYLFHQFHGDKSKSYKVKDTDLTTNLSEEEILQKLRSPSAMRTGIRVAEKQSVDTFGVVFASVGKSETYEIAPFRKDVGTADGRRPETTERGTIYDDAMRRDLTMNNLYYDFEKKKIIDLNPGGQGINDIRDQVTRPVGDPLERFEEDRLRVLRLIRFFSRFNPGNARDVLDERTLAAIDHYKSLPGITPERIQDEFLKGLASAQNTSAYLRSYADLGLFERVFDGMTVDVQNIERLGNSKNPKVVLAWLLRENAENTAQQLNGLKYSNEVTQPVQFLINTMTFGPESAFSTLRQRDKRLLGRNTAGPGGEKLTDEDITAKNDQITQGMKRDLDELAMVAGDPQLTQKLSHLASYQSPKISGQELMQQGFEGPDIGAEQQRRTNAHYQTSFQDFLRKKRSSNEDPDNQWRDESSNRYGS